MLMRGGKKIAITSTREIMVLMSTIIQDTRKNPTTILMNRSAWRVERVWEAKGVEQTKKRF
jgi:hypothetical protein